MADVNMDDVFYNIFVVIDDADFLLNDFPKQMTKLFKVLLKPVGSDYSDFKVVRENSDGRDTGYRSCTLTYKDLKLTIYFFFDYTLVSHGKSEAYTITCSLFQGTRLNQGKVFASQSFKISGLAEKLTAKKLYTLATKVQKMAAGSASFQDVIKRYTPEEILKQSYHQMVYGVLPDIGASIKDFRDENGSLSFLLDPYDRLPFDYYQDGEGSYDMWEMEYANPIKDTIHDYLKGKVQSDKYSLSISEKGWVLLDFYL
jgi:hypothetical protein